MTGADGPMTGAERAAPASDLEGVVSLEGELDIASGPAASAAIAAALDRGEDVVLDLRGLGFMDVRGLHVVLDATRHARARRQRLAVVRGPATVDIVFTLTGTDKMIDLIGLTARDPASLALALTADDGERVVASELRPRLRVLREDVTGP